MNTIGDDSNNNQEQHIPQIDYSLINQSTNQENNDKNSEQNNNNKMNNSETLEKIPEENNKQDKIFNDKTDTENNKSKTTKLTAKLTAKQKAAAKMVILISGIYLLNPTFGAFELPDNFAIIGHIDETFAAAFFLGALKYSGYDSYPWVKKIINFIASHKNK